MAGTADSMPLYPDEEQVARAVMGPKRSREWSSKAQYLEAHKGFPRINPFFGGRYWPAVLQWFAAENGVQSGQADGGAPRSNICIVPPQFPDEESYGDATQESASRHQRRDRRVGRARP